MTRYRNVFFKLNYGLVFAPRWNASQFYQSSCRDAIAALKNNNFRLTSLKGIKHGAHLNDGVRKSPKSKGRSTGPKDDLEDLEGSPAQSVDSKINEGLCNQVVKLMRTQPHGLAAVVAPSELPSRPIESKRPKSKVSNDLPPTKSGMLISSLNSVQIQPVPYISFNVTLPSETYNRIRDYEFFTITGLNDATTARAFVTKGYVEEQKHSDPQWAQFVDKEGRVTSHCGGTWWMKCKLSDYSTRVANNRIIVAKVISAGPGVLEMFDGDSAGRRPGTAMVYLDGEYRYMEYRTPVISERSSELFQSDGDSTDHDSEESSDKAAESRG